MFNWYLKIFRKIKLSTFFEYFFANVSEDSNKNNSEKIPEEKKNSPKKKLEQTNFML